MPKGQRDHTVPYTISANIALEKIKHYQITIRSCIVDYGEQDPF